MLFEGPVKGLKGYAKRAMCIHSRAAVPLHAQAQLAQPAIHTCSPLGVAPQIHICGS